MHGNLLKEINTEIEKISTETSGCCVIPAGYNSLNESKKHSLESTL